MARDANDSTEVSKWTYDHFLSLLLLYASFADFEYTENEKEHILTYVNADILKEVEKHYNTLGDYRQLELVLKLKKRFIKSSADKQKLLAILTKHFKSDGEYSKPEASLYQFLEKLI